MTTDTPPPRNWHLTRWLLVFIVAVFGWGGWRAYAFRSALAEARALGWQVLYTDPVETIRKNWKAAFKKETWLDGVTQVFIPTSETVEQRVAIVYRLNPKLLRIDDASTLRDLSALSPLTRLQQVSLGGGTGLQNVDGLMNLCDLKFVSLSGCTGITNVDALKNLSALEEIYLSNCKGLTNVDVLKNLSALQKVWLYGCTGLTNVDGLKDLSGLKQVSLYGCTGLTNIDALKNFSALKVLDLKGCTGLTKESVAALKAALPNAKIFGP